MTMTGGPGDGTATRERLGDGAATRERLVDGAATRGRLDDGGGVLLGVGRGPAGLVGGTAVTGRGTRIDDTLARLDAAAGPGEATGE
jgi:hypothetical protein